MKRTRGVTLVHKAYTGEPRKKKSKSEKDLKSTRNMVFLNFFFKKKVKLARNMYMKSEPWSLSIDIVSLEVKISAYR